MRKVLLCIAVLLGMATALVLWVVYSRFWRYQSRVDAILRSIPAEERTLSPAARDVFLKVDGELMPWIVTRGLLHELTPAQVRMSEWNLRGAIWNELLPRRLSQDELLLLYGHCMYFKGGRGIAYGAAKYCSTTPDKLTTEQAITLCGTQLYPLQPERFAAGIARCRAEYVAATANASRKSSS